MSTMPYDMWSETVLTTDPEGDTSKEAYAKYEKEMEYSRSIPRDESGIPIRPTVEKEDLTVDANNNSVPDYLETDPNEGVSPFAPGYTPPMVDTDNNQIPDFVESVTMEDLQSDYDKDGTVPDYNLWSEAWKRKNPNVPVPDESTFNTMFSPISEDQKRQLPIDDPLHPDYMNNLISNFQTDPGLNVAKPHKTIKELVEGMDIKKNLPDWLGGAGSLVKGLGPLWATKKAGLDTDEINYFENVEDAAIAEQEKGLDVFDKGKEEARRVIDRERRQGINRLDDYVMSAGQRRAGSRALDVAAMEQMPLSDLRFDTQKGQLYNQIAQSRLQGDVYDASGATARDDKLDQNRDNYYSNISDNLSTLGTEMQGFAKNLGQKKMNQLKELAYLNNMSRGELDRWISDGKGGIMENPDWVGTGTNPDDTEYFNIATSPGWPSAETNTSNTSTNNKLDFASWKQMTGCTENCYEQFFQYERS